MTAEKSDTGTKSVPKKGTLPSGLAKSGNKSRGREILFHRRQLLKLSCDTREVREIPDGDCVGIACPEPGLFHCLEMSPRSSLAPCAPELTVLVEAMNCGLPCVSFDITGANSIIDNGKNGFLVPDNDVNALAEACIKLIENKVLLEDMGKQAYMSGKRFSKPKVMQKWLDLFRELMRE